MSKNAPHQKRGVLKLAAIVLVVSLTSILLYHSQRPQENFWCEYGSTWIDGEGCMCDISTSPSACVPDELGVNILFPHTSSSTSQRVFQLESNTEHTFRVQLRTSGSSALPIFASDVNFGKEHGVKAVAARVEGTDEVFLLEDPKVLRWGTWEFSFHVRTYGPFTVTVYFQGSSIMWPESPSVSSNWPGEAFHDSLSSLENAPVGRYEFEAYYPGDHSPSHQGFQAMEQLSRMKICEPKKLADMRGRWLNTTAFSGHLSKDFATKFIPPTPAKGSTQFFVGDTCLMRYVTSEAAQQCFRNQDINFIGDSTVEEYFLDFAMHLQDQDETSDESDVLPPDWPSTFGSSKGCDATHAFSRLSLWKYPKINSTITFNWLGHHHLCDNLEGITSMDNEYGRFRILNVLADPYAVMQIPLEVEGGQSQDLPSPPEERLDRNRESTVVYGTALHDLYAMRRGEVTLEGYAAKMEDAAKSFGRYATKRYFLPSSAVLNHNNHAVRFMNQVAADGARSHKYDVLPHYFIKNQRPLVDGDWHHASRMWVNRMRTPVLHVGTQAFLNVACQEFI